MSENLKKLQSEIIKGYSKYNFQGKCLYVKHIDIFISGELEEIYADSLEKAAKKGVKTYQEKLQEVYSSGEWTQKEERDLEEKIDYVKRLEETKRKMFLKSQIEYMKFEIAEFEKKIKELQSKKDKAIGITAESFADKRINDKFFFLSSFSDENLKNSFWTEEDYDELEPDEYISISSKFLEHTEKFSSRTLKKISISPSFMNYFYICSEDPCAFWGKPVAHLSFYQNEVFSHAKYYKSILANTNGIPDDIKDDPDKIVEWFETNKNAEKVLSKYDKDNSNVSLVGATKEDLDHIGLGGQVSKNNLIKEAAKRGGKLSMEDMLRISNV